MGMGFAPTWLRQVSPPASQNHFNHWYWLQQDQTGALKKARACVTDERRQTDQMCTRVESNREKIKRPTVQKMDGLY